MVALNRVYNTTVISDDLNKRNDDAETLETAINDNTTNIATNTTNIATNTANIENTSPPSDAVIHYSFDKMLDLPGESGAEYYYDNNFTSVPSGWIKHLSPVDTFSDGIWSLVSTVGQVGYHVELSGIVKIEFELVSGSVTVGFENNIRFTSSTVGRYEKIFYSSALAIFTLYCTYGEIRVTKLYVGDGTTSQPVIDNALGNYNTTCNGVVSTRGVSGKGAQVLEKQSIPINLVDYANVQGWTTSFWTNFHYTTFTVNSRLYNFGTKDYCLVDNSNDSSATNLFYFFTFISSAAKLSIGITRDKIFEALHHITIVTKIISSALATKKVYIDGVLAGSATSTADFTSLEFGTGYLGGSSLTVNVANAMFDDFQFFDYALSTEQIKSLSRAKGQTIKYYTGADYKLSLL